MKHIPAKAAVTAMVSLVAACGGGGGGGGNDMPRQTGPGYNALVNEQVDFLKRYNLANSFGVVDPYAFESNLMRHTTDRMPARGTATYTGVGSVIPGNEDQVVSGRAKLKANFDDGKLAGRVDGFKARPGNTAGGSLTVDADIFGAAAIGDTKGTVSLNGRNYKFDQKIAGVFLGDKADSIGLGSSENADHVVLITADK